MISENTLQYLPTGFEKLADFDTAIKLTGYGRFHYKIITVCALCLLTNGLQNGLSSYVFSAAQCELNITSVQLSLLNVSFLVGGICSAFLWGAVADAIGRKPILIATLLLDFWVTFFSAFTNGFIPLLFCRYLNGFLIGAPGSITFNYIAEFHAPNQRAKSVCYMGAFFTAAWTLLPVLSLIILPQDPFHISRDIFISSWRCFLIAISIPELLTGYWLYWIPESPKFLSIKGKHKQALKILKAMYAANTGEDAENFPIKMLIGINTRMTGVTSIGKSKRLFIEMLMQIKKLFMRPTVVVTTLVCTISFCNMFGYFGLGLWLPELFLRFESEYENIRNETIFRSLPDETNNSCNVEFNYNLFLKTLSTGSASLVGNILSGWLSGKIAINITPLITMAIGCVAAGCIYWLNNSEQYLIISCIFQASMATANVAIGSVAVDLFPSTAAAMALCLTIFVGRLGAMISNVIFGLFIDDHFEIPIFMVACILFLGTLLCLLIPRKNTTSKLLNKLRISVITK